MSNNKERVNQEIKSWLLGCPASDINFRVNLKNANAATCRAALRSSGPYFGKTARRAIQARLRALMKLQAQGVP